MSETTDSITREVCDDVEVTVTPQGGGEIKLTVTYNDAVIESGDYPFEVFSKPWARGTFTNNVRDALEDKPGVAGDEVKQELTEWCAGMADMAQEEEAEMYPATIQEIVAGTESVEVYSGEPTTWRVTITFNGKTADIDFTAGEMVGNSGAPLREKIANEFYELVEVETEDWEHIRDQWRDRQQIALEGVESSEDAIADRIIDNIAEVVRPTMDRDKLNNDPGVVWYDETNESGYEDAPADAEIVWVQDTLACDELEDSGKTLEWKGEFIKNLIQNDRMYGQTSRRRWTGKSGKRYKFWPFQPDALGIDKDDVSYSGPADADADQEVEP